LAVKGTGREMCSWLLREVSGVLGADEDASDFSFVIPFLLQPVRVNSENCAKLTQRYVEESSVALFCNCATDGH
jgi:hypothetical protein